jgi:hypothetical protein
LILGRNTGYTDSSFKPTLSMLAQEAKFLACVREAAGLNPGRNTNYTDSSFKPTLSTLAQEAKSLASVREAPGLNLGRNTGYTDSSLSIFASVPRGVVQSV